MLLRILIADYLPTVHLAEEVSKSTQLQFVSHSVLPADR